MRHRASADGHRRCPLRRRRQGPGSSRRLHWPAMCVRRHRRNHHSVAHAAPGVRSRPSTSVGGFLVSGTCRSSGRSDARPDVSERESPDRSHRRRRHRPRGHRRGPQGRRAPPASSSTPSTTTSAAPATCATARSCPTRSLDEWRGFDAILLGAVGTPEVPPGVIERGLLLKMRFDLDLYVNQRPVPAARTSDIDFIVDPREHRGHLRRRGRLPAQGHAARDRHPGLGQHPHGRRALRPLRVRAGPEPARASTSRWCTRPTCSPSPATCGSARSTRSPPSTPTSTTAYNHVDAACIYFVQARSATT